MSILIVSLGLLVLLLAVWLLKTFSTKINFFATGLDQKFTLGEISILWKLAKIVDLEEPETLFVSTASLTRCITNLIETSKRDGTDSSLETQNFLAKLYKFRTKIELASENRRGLESSKALSNGQKLRLILKGSGVFASRILNNSRDLIITIPIQDGRIKIPPEDWKDKEISVYLWRKGDAGYVFDTKVLAAGIFLGQNVLYVAHSNNLFRAQKRKSIRTECHIPAQLYIIKEAVTEFAQVETAPGFKCFLEDISSDGALIRVGGKGVNNIQVKLQFEIDDTLILMYCLVRSVEYNSANNQSRLHLECLHIEPSMRNAILSFVYKVLPEDQKNAEVALSQLEDEQKADDKKAAEEAGQAAPAEEKPVTETEENSYSIEIPTAIDPEFLSKDSGNL
ncbi:MAG: PilZ domain-containing protein [Treponema sp.]|nr:PilZ domain-containing protein [Treponema sp.]